MIKRLYKYRECNESSISNLDNGTCWFSPVKFMNDPFEAHLCTSHVKLMLSAARLNVERHKISFDVALDAVVRAESDGAMDVMSLLEELKEDVRNTFSAFCLSSRWDSPVMWGHYASNYKGFCIGFEFDDALNWHGPQAFQFPNNTFIGRVNYINSAIDYLDGAGNIIMANLVDVLISKHKDWQYEDEYRFAIKSNPGQGEVKKIPNSALKEVIVGNKIDPTCLEKIRIIAARSGIPVYRVIHSTSEYKIIKVAV